jgi:hypothetical protein
VVVNSSDTRWGGEEMRKELGFQKEREWEDGEDGSG